MLVKCSFQENHSLFRKLCYTLKIGVLISVKLHLVKLIFMCSLIGEGLDNFWKVLLEGKNCSVPIPSQRFDLDNWYDPDENKPGRSRTKKAALIDGYDF